MIEHPIDKKIVKALGASRLNAYSLSQKIGLGKTTVQYRLNKMAKFGLIERFVISDRKITYGTTKKATNEIHDSRLVEVFTGANVTKAYESFIESRRQSSIYSVQGTSAIQLLLKDLPNKFVKEAHARYKHKSILIKGFINENAKAIIQNMRSDIVKSHTGRTVGLKLLNGNILRGDDEILCSKSAVMFHNARKRRAIVIKDRGISEFIYEILDFSYNEYNVPIFPLNDFLAKLK